MAGQEIKEGTARKGEKIRKLKEDGQDRTARMGQLEQDDKACRAIRTST
jgi:hypothetical protein